jgi:hypothetical protein
MEFVMYAVLVWLAIAFISYASVLACSGPARGPLRVLQSNPHYFSDGNGRAIYLTGSHNDPNLLDIGTTDPPPVFDYSSYLLWLQRHNHNFIRLWRWTEAPKFKFWPGDPFQYVEPHPWMRTGPGTARDGKLKFDLSRFNPSYFERLRSRAIEAGKLGMYVSIMLFEGGAALYADEFWAYHPFHSPNNINHIEADRNGDGKGLEFYTLQDSTITAVQKAYVRRILETVNDLDNVLYEICNESHEDSTDWQYMLIRYIKDFEAGLKKQHPVGMTTQHGESLMDNANLLNSEADWISPSSNAYENFAFDPPVPMSGKVSILDSDHITPGSSNVDVAWVWKSFTRGHNPIFIEPIIAPDSEATKDKRWKDAAAIRRNMGYTLAYANRLDFAAMTPHEELCSSRYCLVNPGHEYVVFVPLLAGEVPANHSSNPFAGEVAVDLTTITGTVRVEWLNTNSGDIITGTTVMAGSMRTFHSPFKADSVLYLQALQ